jgi:hypothetical protein
VTIDRCQCATIGVHSRVTQWPGVTNSVDGAGKGPSSNTSRESTWPCAEITSVGHGVAQPTGDGPLAGPRRQQLVRVQP